MLHCCHLQLTCGNIIITLTVNLTLSATLISLSSGLNRGSFGVNGTGKSRAMQRLGCPKHKDSRPSLQDSHPNTLLALAICGLHRVRERSDALYLFQIEDDANGGVSSDLRAESLKTQE
ncbi:hypothetical protein BDW59DRAFT_115059 [Aspergillus cavernicola]|uniref:Uncharacterized protein n=1 Tax=Aspergillus cavernicola TaxID=176166 RepID=A0ABR4IWC7_9EURO